MPSDGSGSAGHALVELRTGGGLPAADEPSELHFRNVDEVISYIESVEDKDRYVVQSQVLERMVRYHERSSDMIEQVFDYIRASGDYKAYVSEQEFKEEWEGVAIIVDEHKKVKSRRIQAASSILKEWDSELARDWVAHTDMSANYMEGVRFAAKRLTFAEAVERVNAIVIERVTHPRRGVSTSRAPLTNDWKRAHKWEGESQPLVETQLKVIGLQLNRWGLVEEYDGHGVRDVLEDVETDGTGVADLARKTGEIEIELGDVESDGTESASERRSPGSRSPRRVPIAHSVDDEQDGEPSHSESDAEAADSEEAAWESREDRRGTGCRCSGEVSMAWQKAVSKKTSYPLHVVLRLLGRMLEFRTVCYPHLKAMGGHVGLRLKQLSAGDLLARLQHVYERRLEIGRLKTNHDTYRWFRTKSRPAHATDALGPYKFFPKPRDINFDLDPAAILQDFSAAAWGDWQRDGSVSLDVFSWWFESDIGQIILAEFDMYLHHLRKINGKENYGWLRSMFYSIGQQLMRQDPVYYALYAALRPDRNWRLVTYPYYAKYARKGDKTYFRHIDLNIPTLLSSGRGCNMIQGSVSLDDEDETNCTVILAGMQNHLGEWWERCKARGQETDGAVHRITESMFTKDDAAALGIDWKRVPCRRGEVRVTLPHIPHGADGPSTGTRRTMLPWFVGVQEDLESLEVAEGGSWSDLATAHRDLTAPIATPSGLANRYGAIPYRFPAAVELAGLGALSDALVCRRRWDSPQVLGERDTMLGVDRAAAGAFVKSWRARATEEVTKAFNAVMDAERRAFGDRSYFYLKDRSSLRGLPMPEVDSDSDAEEGDDEDGGACEADTMEFAEAGMVEGEA